MSIEELFSVDTVLTMCGELDLNGKPCVVPEQNWFTYIKVNAKDLIDRGQKVIDTYINFADPELIRMIHFLINDSSYVGRLHLVNDIYNIDVIAGIPRPLLLECYIIPPNEIDYQNICQLTAWCRKQHTLLSNLDGGYAADIFPIAEHITIINPSSKPTSIMSKEQKEKAFDKFKTWQDKQKTT